mgnify:CR=1 FL=1
MALSLGKFQVKDRKGILISKAPPAAAELLSQAAGGDTSLVWFRYPKKFSKRYAADFSRDEGWEPGLNLG